MTKVLAHVPDLMDQSRFLAAGLDVRFVSKPEALIQQDDLHEVTAVVVDLSRPGVLDVVEKLKADGVGLVVGFGPHVESQLLEAASAAGAYVMARSAFFKDVVAAVSVTGQN